MELPGKREKERVAALRSYGILDSPPEQAFDDCTMIASHICRTPVALITLIDEKRQWFKSRVGIDIKETPREVAFCNHTILGKGVMTIEDATRDHRFKANPCVVGHPNIRFYAGVPLVNPDGFALGALCVIDSKPSTLARKTETILEGLGRQVMAQIELRKILADSIVIDGPLPICTHCKSIRCDEEYWENLETYILSKAEAKISHCICPGCMRIHHPKIYAELKAEGKI